MSIDFWKKEMMRLTNNREVLNTNRVLNNQDKGAEQISSSGIGVIYNATGKFLGRIGTSELVRVINTNTSITDNGYNGIIRTTHSAWKNNKPKTYNYQGGIILENSSVLSILRYSELNVRVMLSVLRRAEGHGYQSVQPYNAMYPNTTFSSYAKHPKEESYIGAGAYGIMGGNIWEYYKKTLGFEGALLEFSPQNQDATAVRILKDKGALELVKAGEILGAIRNHKMRAAWTSLPGGKEQAVTENEVQQFILNYTVEELEERSSLATPQGYLKIY